MWNVLTKLTKYLRNDENMKDIVLTKICTLIKDKYDYKHWIFSLLQKNQMASLALCVSCPMVRWWFFPVAHLPFPSFSKPEKSYLPLFTAPDRNFLMFMYFNLFPIFYYGTKNLSWFILIEKEKRGNREGNIPSKSRFTFWCHLTIIYNK